MAGKYPNSSGGCYSIKKICQKITNLKKTYITGIIPEKIHHFRSHMTCFQGIMRDKNIKSRRKLPTFFNLLIPKKEEFGLIQMRLFCTAWEFLLLHCPRYLTELRRSCNKIQSNILHKSCLHKSCLHKSCLHKSCLHKSCLHKSCLHKSCLHKSC
jgi:hypothetical protein